MRFSAPTDLGAALAVLAEHGPDVHVLAGGTDLMIQMQRGELTAKPLLSIGRLAELRAMSMNGTTRIGALTTHRALAADAGIAEMYPGLATAATVVGGWQTQAVGTIGGNICNASPAADLAAPLLVNDAVVRLRSATAERSVPYAEFVTGRRATLRQSDELVVGVDLPTPPPTSAETYLKVGRRNAMEIAIVGLAMRLDFDDDGRVGEARLAASAVGVRPRRFADAEAALGGRPLTEATLAAATAAVAAAIAPIDDVRSSADYRKRLIPGLVRRAALQCAATRRVAVDAKETPWS